MIRTPGLFTEAADRGAFVAGTWRSVVLGPLAYAAAAVVSWASTPAAFVGYAAIALYFVFPHSTRGR
jgi:hypothetical protein